MRDLTDRVLDTAAQLGASYADVRVIRRRDESIAVKSGRVEGVAMGESDGFGVRVVVDGAWGFAASDTLDMAEADRVGALAVRIAKASSTALRRPVELDGRAPATGTFETPVEEDPFKIPLEAKISDLVAADRAAGRVKGVTFTESVYSGHREWKTFAATDGSFTEQVITQVGTAVEANAIEGDEHQRRSYPDAGGGYQAAGYEYIRGLDLLNNAEPIAEESVALLSAPQLPPGKRTIVLDPSMLYLQIHESLRPPERARPRLRHRGVVRGHELPDAGQADRGLPVRLGAGDDRRRRHGVRAASARSAGTTRASPRRPCRSSRTAGSSATSRAARPRRGSGGSPGARCAPTAGTASR